MNRMMVPIMIVVWIATISSASESQPLSLEGRGRYIDVMDRLSTSSIRHRRIVRSESPPDLTLSLRYNEFRVDLGDIKLSLNLGDYQSESASSRLRPVSTGCSRADPNRDESRAGQDAVVIEAPAPISVGSSPAGVSIVHDDDDGDVSSRSASNQIDSERESDQVVPSISGQLQ